MKQKCTKWGMEFYINCTKPGSAVKGVVLKRFLLYSIGIVYRLGNEPMSRAYRGTYVFKCQLRIINPEVLDRFWMYFTEVQTQKYFFTTVIIII